MTSRSAGCPKASTARIALVLGVIAASIRAESILYVSGRMSTNTGRARSNSRQLADAMKLNGVVMTSSPSPIPSARTIRCRADVPLLTATPCATPATAANPASNSGKRGPKLRCELLRTPRTADSSEASIHCEDNGTFMYGLVSFIYHSPGRHTDNNRARWHVI
jgi:hypothetical protein